MDSLEKAALEEQYTLLMRQYRRLATPEVISEINRLTNYALAHGDLSFQWDGPRDRYVLVPRISTEVAQDRPSGQEVLTSRVRDLEQRLTAVERRLERLQEGNYDD